MDNSGLPESQVQQSQVPVSHAAYRGYPGCLTCLLTCPLCIGIFKEATTIRECMHTFCKECIYQKVQTEGITCCPSCNVDLSHLSPEDYLWPDVNWRVLVNNYLGLPQSNEQATPPPSLSATTSESTDEQSQEQEPEASSVPK